MSVPTRSNTVTESAQNNLVTAILSNEEIMNTLANARMGQRYLKNLYNMRSQGPDYKVKISNKT